VAIHKTSGFRQAAEGQSARVSFDRWPRIGREIDQRDACEGARLVKRQSSSFTVAGPFRKSTPTRPDEPTLTTTVAADRGASS